MQRFDAELLAKNLNAIAEVFDRKHMTPAALQAWFDTLKEFPTERVMSVLIGWPKTHGKFPTPAEVWKSCNEMVIDDREAQALRDKAAEPAWTRSPRGAEFLAKMKKMLRSQKPSPEEHWRRVMEKQKPGDIGYEYAKQALEKRKHREPGEDDEPQAVNF
jgi:hypothetical protein